MKVRAGKVLTRLGIHSMLDENLNPKHSPTIGRWYNNLQRCSCSSCGNQRHTGWGDPFTIAEKRANDSAREQITFIDEVDVHDPLVDKFLSHTQR